MDDARRAARQRRRRARDREPLMARHHMMMMMMRRQENVQDRRLREVQRAREFVEGHRRADPPGDNPPVPQQEDGLHRHAQQMMQMQMRLAMMNEEDEDLFGMDRDMLDLAEMMEPPQPEDEGDQEMFNGHVFEPEQQQQDADNIIPPQDNLHRRFMNRMQRLRRRNMAENQNDPLAEAAAAVWEDFERLHAETADDAVAPQNVLFQLISEDVPCCQVLGGAGNCNSVLERLREHPEEARYVCPQNGRTPLHAAAKVCACPHIISALVQQRSMLTLMEDNDGNLPVHSYLNGLFSKHVADAELRDSLRLLHEPQPSLVASKTNGSEDLPLHSAMLLPERIMSTETVSTLIGYFETAKTRTNELGFNPLSLHCQRRTASVEVARLLLRPFLFGTIPSDLRGESALFHAVRNEHVEIVELIIAECPEALLKTNNGSETVLHHCRNPAILELLMQHVSQLALKRSANQRFTPIHLICRLTDEHNVVELARVVIRHAHDSLALDDREGYNALHHACCRGSSEQSIELVRLLVTAQPRLAKMKTKHDDTALSLAVHCGPMVDILLQAYPDATRVANQYGFLPLHSACLLPEQTEHVVKALVAAYPAAVDARSHAGQTPAYLCSTRPRILRLVTETLRKPLPTRADGSVPAENRTDELGNTALHTACIHGASRATLESIVVSNPKSIVALNKAGYSSLQLLCRSGRLETSIINLMVRMAGTDRLLGSPDPLGNTCLHSAMRPETDPAALKTLMSAYPPALNSRTMYDDTPLHLACFRKVSKSVIQDTIVAGGWPTMLLSQNKAGQTPVGIVLEEYLQLLNCQDELVENRSYQLLVLFAKILHYGTVQPPSNANIVHACVALHRKNVRLHPAFIRQVIQRHPMDVQEPDKDGYHPVHIEASIPIEKMSLLNGPSLPACPVHPECHDRASLLRLLLDIYPDATRVLTPNGFLLEIMLNGRSSWESGTASRVAQLYPPAVLVLLQTGVPTHSILGRLVRDCTPTTVFQLLRERPSHFIGDV